MPFYNIKFKKGNTSIECTVFDNDATADETALAKKAADEGILPDIVTDLKMDVVPDSKREVVVSDSVMEGYE